MTKLRAADAFRHDTYIQNNNGARKQSYGHCHTMLLKRFIWGKPHRATKFARVIKHASEDNKEYFSLSIAVQRGHSRAVEVLLKYGANPISGNMMEVLRQMR